MVQKLEVQGVRETLLEEEDRSAFLVSRAADMSFSGSRVDNARAREQGHEERGN